MGCAAIGDRHGDANIRVTGVGGEDLAAVDHPARAVFHRFGAHARGVGAGFRFGERPRSNPFAGGELGNVLAALLVAAGDIDVIGAQRIVRRHDQAYGRIDARELFNDDGILDVAEPRAAQVFREDGSEKAKLAGMFDYVERKDLLFIPAQNVRTDFLLGKFADAFANWPQGFAICTPKSGSAIRSNP